MTIDLFTKTQIARLPIVWITPNFDRMCVLPQGSILDQKIWPSPCHHCTVDVFAIFSPVFSLRIFYKKHAKNHTSNKPRAFKICVQLSFDKLIWYTKFHKDWSTRRQKHHWSKFFDGLVKYRTENRKTVHCELVGQKNS